MGTHAIDFYRLERVRMAITLDRNIDKPIRQHKHLFINSAIFIIGTNYLLCTPKNNIVHLGL